METVLAYTIGVMVVVVGLAISIGLHEIGHLVPAKLFGVRVLKYMIGFGPRLWSRQKGETEYGVRAIPLGGYISMIGMFPPQGAGAETEATAGPEATADESSLPSGQELAPELESRRGRAASSSSSRGWGLTFFRNMVQDARDSSEETVGAGDESRTFYRLTPWKRIIIMLGGPIMNLLLAIVFFAILLMGFGQPQATTTLGSISQCVLTAADGQRECQPGDPKAPAAQAGLQPGDRIVSLNGTRITAWEQVTQIIRAHSGLPLSVTVSRGGLERTLSVIPATTTLPVFDNNGTQRRDASGSPVTTEAGYIGVGPTSARVPQSFPTVLSTVGDSIGRTLAFLPTLPARLIDVAKATFGVEKRDPNGPLSVVGVGRLAGEIASLPQITIADKVSSFIGLLASLNVMLFVLNLLPLLPLDGGHVVGALWESLRRAAAKLRGRPTPLPVDIAKLMPVTFVVVVFFIAMSALLIIADFVKPITLQ